ncbi:MAG: Abi family protein [Spirochaetales bacterium]
MSQNKPQYAKPALSIKEQVQKLFSQGLKGVTEDELGTFLSRISNYRLRGYMYPYQDNSKKESPFLSDVTWNMIVDDYNLDTSLRALLFEAISYIEITLRTQIILNMSLAHNPRWYENDNLFYKKEQHKHDVEKLLKSWRGSKEIFVKHYHGNYDSSLVPPAWMIFETATIGTLSKFFENIETTLQAKHSVAQFFGFTKNTLKILVSWIKHITHIRNICAHHGRLFSCNFTVTAQFPKKVLKPWISILPRHNKIYGSICIITYLMNYCNPTFDFSRRIKTLMHHAPERRLHAMGFPLNWQDEDLFK